MNITHREIVARLIAELERATTKFPKWPTDPIHALAVVQEELGEVNCAVGKLAKEVLQLCYEHHKASIAAVREEATQVAAMAIRFLFSVDRYEFETGAQHSQSADKSDGWIAHDGHECPLEPKTRVQVKLRNGMVFEGRALTDDACMDSEQWIDDKYHDLTIIAYRLA